MTSLLLRLDESLKKEFETLTSQKGLSMNFVLTNFVRAYTKNPDIIRVSFDETAFNQAWDSPEVRKGLSNLGKSLKKK